MQRIAPDSGKFKHQRFVGHGTTCAYSHTFGMESWKLSEMPIHCFLQKAWRCPGRALRRCPGQVCRGPAAPRQSRNTTCRKNEWFVSNGRQRPGIFTKDGLGLMIEMRKPAILPVPICTSTSMCVRSFRTSAKDGYASSHTRACAGRGAFSAIRIPPQDCKPRNQSRRRSAEALAIIRAPCALPADRNLTPANVSAAGIFTVTA